MPSSLCYRLHICISALADVFINAAYSRTSHPLSLDRVNETSHASSFDVCPVQSREIS